MYVPHEWVADWSLERSAFFVLLCFGSLQAGRHTLCVILGLEPRIHKPLTLLENRGSSGQARGWRQSVERLQGQSRGNISSVSLPRRKHPHPNKKGPPFPVTPHALRWIGDTQCAASGGGAAFGFLISTVRKISPVNRKVKSRNTSAKARIHACCDTTPTSFLIATDAPSRP